MRAWLIGVALAVIVITTLVLGDYGMTLGVMVGWLIGVWIHNDWPKPRGFRRVRS